MQTILVVGAGKTSVYLIEYLLKHSIANRWKVIVADNNIDAIVDKTKEHKNSEAAVIDITDNQNRELLVQRADIVVSLMPPHLHILLAEDCLKYTKHLITSSYISPKMKELDTQAKNAGLMFMCEMGLDPGIDHMSASNMIHSIHKVAATVTSFKSYAGGVIAPEYDDNPWHYKFTWNPKNIVLAGNMGAKHLVDGEIVEIPYEEVFANPKKLHVSDELGELVYYPNRDSIKYLDKYDLPDVKTFIRATLRYQGFCVGWDAVIKLGLTDDKKTVNANTYAEWLVEANGFDSNQPLKEQVVTKLSIPEDSNIVKQLEWLGVFEEVPIKSSKKTSADILLNILLEKWTLRDEDKDLILMVHEIEYQHRNKSTTTLTSTMTLKGEGNQYSAMAKTVGLPMAILAKLILTKKVKPVAGVQIPNMPTIYKPVLAELEENGIVFTETVS